MTVALLTFGTLLVAGCSHRSSGRSPSSAPASSRRPGRLAAELLGRVDDRGSATFTERFRHRCMAGHHLRYVERPYRNLVQVGLGLSATLEERRQRGFGISTTGEQQQSLHADPNLTLIDGLPKASRTRYLATLESCTRDADAEVQRRRAALDRALSKGDRAYIDGVMGGGDGRAPRAIAAWHGCMRGKGFSFADPGAMMEHLNGAFGSIDHGDPRAVAAFERREVAVSVAEYGCNKRFVEPVLQDAVRGLARRLQGRYGVTSLYSTEWHLRGER